MRVRVGRVVGRVLSLVRSMIRTAVVSGLPKPLRVLSSRRWPREGVVSATPWGC